MYSLTRYRSVIISTTVFRLNEATMDGALTSSLHQRELQSMIKDVGSMYADRLS